ncbi:hypothetical protein ACOSP7_022994 [Xanthoceras sorbifolium]
MERIGPVPYCLELPARSLIHNVFHVSLLTRHIGPFPPMTAEDTILPQPESILDSRVIQKGKYLSKEEVLIKWVGAPIKDATWENKRHLLRIYPEFILEDKDSLRG